jgi:hypothetical protein
LKRRLTAPFDTAETKLETGRGTNEQP